MIDNPPNTERKLGAIPNSIYKIHNPLGIKYLTRLGIGLSHLKEHNSSNSFQDSIDPMCSCGSGIETAVHFVSPLRKFQ